MKNRRRNKFNPYLKFFCVKFSRGLIFTNYQNRNFLRGFNFANCTFRNILRGLNSRKPRNLIHAKINLLKVILFVENKVLFPKQFGFQIKT